MRLNDQMDSSHTFAELRGLQWSSQFLVDNLNLFGQLGGFQQLLQWITPQATTDEEEEADDDDDDDAVTFTCIKTVAHVVSRVVEVLSRPFAVQYIPQLVDAITNAMLTLSNEELREIAKEDVDEVLYSVTMLLRRVKSTEEEVARVVEMFVLDFSLKCFNSSFLEKKVSDTPI